MHPLPTFVASPFLVFAIRWVAPSSRLRWVAPSSPLPPSLGGPFLSFWVAPSSAPSSLPPRPFLRLPPAATETVYRKKALFSVGVTSTRQQIAKDMSWSEPLSRVASVRLADLELGDRNANIRRQLLVQPQRE
jgi:hypothetical protein